MSGLLIAALVCGGSPEADAAAAFALARAKRERAADCGCPGACGCAPCRCAATAPPGVRWHSDYAAAYAAAEASGRPVVILFTRPADCVHCRLLEAGALADPGVRAGLAACECVRVDAGTADGLALARRFNRPGVPSVVVYRGGRLVGFRDGNVPAGELIGLLVEASSRLPGSPGVPSAGSSGSRSPGS